MTQLVLRIYDCLQRRPLWRRVLLGVLTLGMLLMLTRIRFQEDISAFLPLSAQQQTSMQVYQQSAGADRIVAVVEARDTAAAVSPDLMVEAIDLWEQQLEQLDTAGWALDVMTVADMQQATQTLDFVYQSVPYLLTDADFRRIDSLLLAPDAVAQGVARVKQQLMLPGGSMTAQYMARDPLGLFAPVVARVQATTGRMDYELYEGHIFSADMRSAVAILRSPFGGSETRQNARLMGMLNEVADSVGACYPQLQVSYVGNPVFAVGNASQIRRDSVLSVGLALVAILGLLLWVFGSLRQLGLIALSVVWGWLFAMAVMAVVHPGVSIIVVGISSIIIGIAVNYPLHVLSHLNHASTPRQSLAEIVKPLLTGNITTVGAFLVLVPMGSQALRDLGLFASCLLLGTIVFSLVFLPHMARPTLHATPAWLQRAGRFSPTAGMRWLLPVLFLTLVLGWTGRNVEFDSQLSHLNYMSPQQRQLMQRMQSTLQPEGNQVQMFALSQAPTMDEALDQSMRIDEAVERLRGEGLDSLGHQSATPLLCSMAGQLHRLQLWESFVRRHADSLSAQLGSQAVAQGFQPQAFQPFCQLLHGDFAPQQRDYFAPLTAQVLLGLVFTDSVSGLPTVVHRLSVPASGAERAATALQQTGAYTFDVASIGQAISTHLSDSFNYIGVFCSAIVFLFLWLSMRSLRLALIAFVPMAVSWAWILGIMVLTGLKFNIVNIILASFIFGQGDDYTIFTTEGAVYEQRHGRPILAAYRQSILVSALIMFIGIGSLIIARHPALHSLAQLTIVGMASVVAMAWVLPPILVKLTTRTIITDHERKNT